MKPLVLLSRSVYERNTADLRHARHHSGNHFDWLLYEGPGSIGSDDISRVVGAYLSVDILELSSKIELTEKMADFCNLLLRCEALKFLQVPSAGLDRPIYHDLQERGVSIWDARGIAGTTVALSAFTGMLVLARNMHIHFRKQYQKEWFPVRFTPLEPRGVNGNTAVIFGVGSIGAEIARLCKSLSMKTIGVRKTLGDPIPYFDKVVTQDRMKDVLGTADWVFLACPLTPETFHLIDGDALEKMNEYTGLINVARGEVVDEPALIRALNEGKIRCAYLDVFEREPLDSSSPLWDMENVILTPHAAGDAQTRYENLDRRFIDNLTDWSSTLPMQSRAPTKA